MSLFEILGAILIGPLKFIFEIIFSQAYSVLGNAGLSVIVLSLAMNILVLPLYKRADAIQIEARDTENKLKDVVAHIKKTFSGDERMMILQTYYRQNNYSPLSVLSGSVSLMLEIPFFMAAYQFLSGVGLFSGASFGPIADLSKPDGLLNIGGFAVNALPILMTVINVVSSSLYLKGFPLKTKIQLYGMALFFLVFLYNSPAALVFYWTLNNTFSLGKTLFAKLRPKVRKLLLAAAGAALMCLAFVIHGYWKAAFLLCAGLAAQLPWVLPLVAKKLPAAKSNPTPNTAAFVLGGLFLSVLVGLLIPSTYISASVQEYIDVNYFYNPSWYLVNTGALSVGLFLVWFGVFYWLANPKGKVIFTRLVWILCGVTLVNYMFFGTNLGVVSSDLTYEAQLLFSRKELLLNIGVIVLLAAGLYSVAVRFPKCMSFVLLIGVIALATMGINNTINIAGEARETERQIRNSTEGLPQFNLSKSGQNVVVIMLDRAIGPFVPYLMEENPELQKQFDGFTYYKNTLSYGGFTNFAAPALYGGYDYTPASMNLRDDLPLAEKHDQALKVMPTLFANEGYNATIIDPSYAGYLWIPDLTIFDGMEGVTAYAADGKYNNMALRIRRITDRSRNFFYFSLMKAAPVCLQSAIYNDSHYHSLFVDDSDITRGVNPSFINAYNVLANMDTMTNISSGDDNNYMFLRSNVTHEATILQEPTFTPTNAVDNSAYYSAEGKIITDGNSEYLLAAEYMISHYHVNMAALMQLGDWFDYLRQNNVYDNTRIILVADHGRDLSIFDHDPDASHDIEFYMPLLLVKDFDAKGFTTSTEFMTNADVPALAMEGLIENPTNPYTGNPIDTTGKEDDLYVILSGDWDIKENNGNQFMPSQWATVTGEVWNKENWVFYTEMTLLPPALENAQP